MVPAVSGILAQPREELVERLEVVVEVVGESLLEGVLNREEVLLLRHAVACSADPSNDDGRISIARINICRRGAVDVCRRDRTAHLQPGRFVG